LHQRLLAQTQPAHSHLRPPRLLPPPGEDDAQLSTHERRLRRLQDMVQELETAALAERGWQLRGEIGAGQRPLNSALEVDLDFETTNRWGGGGEGVAAGGGGW
jgi:hypothetical protein